MTRYATGRTRRSQQRGDLVLRAPATDSAFGLGLDGSAELHVGAVTAGLGCGGLLAAAALHEGETVSVRRLGATGRAWGLDMTDEMLQITRANAAEADAPIVRTAASASPTSRSPQITR
ncbi:hypothetical protein GCM10010411_66660 [Actinomadura fulvescens]|uniref:Uncharacterized protein n=1 Tax=Actinomadura fulvescens TaxID=46160 RepID=A0ABP6CMB1_9ACTN